MAIEFQCLNCGRSLRGKDELAGRRVKCPTCAAAIEVPQPADEFAALAAAVPTGDAWSEEDVNPYRPTTDAAPECGVAWICGVVEQT